MSTAKRYWIPLLRSLRRSIGLCILLICGLAVAAASPVPSFIDFEAQAEFALVNLIGPPPLFNGTQPQSDLVDQIVNPFGFSIGLFPGIVSPAVDLMALNAVAFCSGCQDGSYSGVLTVPFHAQVRLTAQPLTFDSSLSFAITDVISGGGHTHEFTTTFPGSFSMDFGNGYVVLATPLLSGNSVTLGTGEFRISGFQVTLLSGSPAAQTPDPSTAVLMLTGIAVLFLLAGSPRRNVSHLRDGSA